MKIRENLWQVGGADLTASEDAAIYLVRFGNAAALIDAGCGYGHDRLVDNISEVLPAEVKITHLLLTHCHFDHAGGAAKVRAHYGCKIVAHKLDAVYLESGDSSVTAATWYGTRMAPVKIDFKIEGDEQTIAVGGGNVEAYHCPGHSPGSLVYLTDLDGLRVLFGQDVHGPLDPSLLSDREDYLRSLQFILELQADILCEGHFGVFDGKDKVAKFIRSYLE